MQCKKDKSARHIMKNNLAIANRSRVSCAQYVDEGIYNNPVTLKPRLGVTQDH